MGQNYELLHKKRHLESFTHHPKNVLILPGLGSRSWKEPPFFQGSRSRIEKNGPLRLLLTISKKVYFLGKI